MRTLILLPTLVLAVASCSSSTGEQPHTATPAIVTTRDGEPLVTCGGASWTPSVMASGVAGVLTDEEAEAIFTDLLESPDTGVEARLSLFPDGVDDVEWKVLDHDGDDLTIGIGGWSARGNTKGSLALDLTRDGDRWRATGWGSCKLLSPVLRDDDLEWAAVTSYSTEPGSSVLTVEVREWGCTSGRDPGTFLQQPEVVETSTSVTIYWTTEPAEGTQGCPGNPPVERTVSLDAPLGDRDLLDGSLFPPTRVPPQS